MRFNVIKGIDSEKVERYKMESENHAHSHQRSHQV